MKYARKCSATGEPMNSGWLFGDGEYYAKYKKDAETYANDAGYDSIDAAYDDDYCYWTEWEEWDYQYEMVDGKLIELE